MTITDHTRKYNPKLVELVENFEEDTGIKVDTDDFDLLYFFYGNLFGNYYGEYQTDAINNTDTTEELIIAFETYKNFILNDYNKLNANKLNKKLYPNHKISKSGHIYVKKEVIKW